MSTLEHLVPAIDLCKKIPEGCFEDSALVWYFREFLSEWVILSRHVLDFGEEDLTDRVFPAPTLEEILLALEEMGFYCPSICHRHTWIAECECDPVDEEADPFPDAPSAADKRSGATAALLLWLDIQTDIHERNRH